MKFCPKCGTPRNANFCGRCGFAFNPITTTGAAATEISTKLIPGWYPDQLSVGFERLWDGDAWTSQLRPTSQAQQTLPSLSMPEQNLNESTPEETASLVYGDGFSASHHCLNCGTPKAQGVSTCILCGC